MATYKIRLRANMLNADELSKDKLDDFIDNVISDLQDQSGVLSYSPKTFRLEVEMQIDALSVRNATNVALTAFDASCLSSDNRGVHVVVTGLKVRQA